MERCHAVLSSRTVCRSSSFLFSILCQPQLWFTSFVLLVLLVDVSIPKWFYWGFLPGKYFTDVPFHSCRLHQYRYDWCPAWVTRIPLVQVLCNSAPYPAFYWPKHYGWGSFIPVEEKLPEEYFWKTLFSFCRIDCRALGYLVFVIDVCQASAYHLQRKLGCMDLCTGDTGLLIPNDLPASLPFCFSF